MAREYVHPIIGEEVRAISGAYTTIKIDVLPAGDRQILFTVVAAYLDTSCCGPGGCAYVLVPGFVIEHQSERKSGSTVSLVEPIQGEGLREQIAKILCEQEKIQEVRFV